MLYNYDFHSCDNCQYLVRNHEEKVVCNAFHILENLNEAQLKQDNTCSDFKQINPFRLWINCQKPTQKELEAFSDCEVNNFNRLYSTSINAEYYRKDSSKIILKFKEFYPTLLLRPNGNCPIKTIDLFEKEVKWLNLKVDDSFGTIYLDGSPKVLTFEVEVGKKNRLINLYVKGCPGLAFGYLKHLHEIVYTS